MSTVITTYSLRSADIDFSPRVHAVVAVAPVIDLHGFPERRRAILELAMQDREAQMAGQGISILVMW